LDRQPRTQQVFFREGALLQTAGRQLQHKSQRVIATPRGPGNRFGEDLPQLALQVGQVAGQVPLARRPAARRTESAATAEWFIAANVLGAPGWPPAMPPLRDPIGGRAWCGCAARPRGLRRRRRGVHHRSRFVEGEPGQEVICVARLLSPTVAQQHLAGQLAQVLAKARLLVVLRELVDGLSPRAPGANLEGVAPLGSRSPPAATADVDRVTSELLTRCQQRQFGGRYFPPRRSLRSQGRCGPTLQLPTRGCPGLCGASRRVFVATKVLPAALQSYSSSRIGGALEGHGRRLSRRM